MLQVEVGEAGSEQHAQREHMLRSAIELQTQLKQSQQKLEALTQQLADTPSEAQDTHTSADAAMPDTHSINATALKGKPNAAAAIQHTSALMDSLFGSDDDEIGTEPDDSQGAQVQKAKAGKQQAGSAAGVAQQRRQTTAGAAQAAGTAHVADRRAGTHANQGDLPNAHLNQSNASDRAHHSATAGPSQQLVDPAAPRRSISFSNSLRRRQASSIQQRRDAFNAAADAAVMQAAAHRSTTGSQAADSASEPSAGAAAAQPEADESRPELPGSSPHKPMHGVKTVFDMHHAPVKLNGVVNSAGMLDKATSVVPSALPGQPSVTQELPGGRVPSAAAPASPAKAAGLMAQGSEEAPKVITRTGQAEPAPKLKTGSRLAASMAKLAASKRAPSDQPAPAAAADPVQQSGEGQKSAIPEDVKKALLAKVRWIANPMPTPMFTVALNTHAHLYACPIAPLPCNALSRCLTIYHVRAASHAHPYLCLCFCFTLAWPLRIPLYTPHFPPNHVSHLLPGLLDVTPASLPITARALAVCTTSQQCNADVNQVVTVCAEVHTAAALSACVTH